MAFWQMDGRCRSNGLFCILRSFSGVGLFRHYDKAVRIFAKGTVALRLSGLTPSYFSSTQQGNYSTGHKIRKINATTGIITTIAGTGSTGYNGDGILAIAANITPNAIALDSLGNLYITDSARIRKIDITTGIISTIGGGGSTLVGDGGPAINASLYVPWGICFDNHGNLYFGEGIGYRLRKINAAGIISTVVGNGVAGYTGDNNFAISAQCGEVFGVCSDKSGNIYFADYIINERVRKIDTAGIITTIGGNGTYTYNGDNIPATSAHIDPLDVKIDAYGNLYVVDFANSRIRKINASGYIYTLAGTGINGYNGDGISANTAKIYYPGGLAIDSCGNIYFGDVGNGRFRKITYPKCGYLSVDEMQTSNQTITIFPNPAYNEITITATVKIKTVTISNLIGQEVYKREYDTEKAEVNIAMLPAGVYVVSTTDNEGKRTATKIIKQ